MLLMDLVSRFSRLMKMSPSADQHSSQPCNLPPTTVLLPSRRRTTATTEHEPRVFAPFSLLTPPSSPSPLQPPTPTTVSGLSTLSPLAKPIGAGCTVLLVDDNIVNQNVGARMLLSLGCRVYIAHDGDDAISQICVCAGVPPPPPNGAASFGSAAAPIIPPRPARSKSLSALTFRRAIAPDPIDLVLMDYQMPLKDGITATREIRALESAGRFLLQANELRDSTTITTSDSSSGYFGKRWPAHLPIVAATTLESAEVRHGFETAGIDGFTKKPFSVKSLGETIREVVQRRERMEQRRAMGCDCCCETEYEESGDDAPAAAAASHRQPVPQTP